MTKRSHFAVGIIALFIGMSSASSYGALSDARYTVSTNAGLPPSLLSALGRDVYANETVAVRLDSDYTGQNQGNTYSIQAQAQTFGAIPAQGISPQAIVAVEVHGTGQTFSGEALASITYEIAVMPTRPDAPDVYVPFRVNGTNFVSGRGTAQLYLNDLLWDSVNITSGYQEHNYSYSYGLNPGVALPIRLTAYATARDGGVTSYPNSSQAGSDPLFTFDQAEFDSMMGASTFNLSDFYGFEYSPGLVTVPEPSAFLFVGGCTIFLSRRRRRISQR